jgi:hypothetical protein
MLNSIQAWTSEKSAAVSFGFKPACAAHALDEALSNSECAPGLLLLTNIASFFSFRVEILAVENGAISEKLLPSAYAQIQQKL